MVSIDYQSMLITARENFKNGNYKVAEPILQQLIMEKKQNPETLQMFGTILYEKGKFNQAIRTFQRALEIDPTYTDASVALSIIYNDLGRYEEGKQVFNEARKILDNNKSEIDPYISERIGRKHEELAELYFQYKKFDEALEQFYRAAILYNKKYPEVMLRIADCYMQKNNPEKAIKELNYTISQYPNFYPAQLSLGIAHYNTSNTSEAIKVWERVLMNDPQNQDAMKYIKIARTRSTYQGEKGTDI